MPSDTLILLLCLKMLKIRIGTILHWPFHLYLTTFYFQVIDSFAEKQVDQKLEPEEVPEDVANKSDNEAEDEEQEESEEDEEDDIDIVEEVLREDNDDSSECWIIYREYKFSFFLVFHNIFGVCCECTLS